MSSSEIKTLIKFQQLLGYEFSDEALLKKALTHSSSVRRKIQSSLQNERLEFLGDAVLSLIVSDLLMEIFPEKAEGDLSKMRASLVNAKTLAKIALNLNVGDYLFLGRGEEKTGGRGKESITSSALEAVIAAIYRDGGLPAARKFIKNHFRKVILEMENELACFDYKSTLQQYLQARHRKVPKYILVNETGPDHKKEFEVKIIFDHKELAKGLGKNKKEAEQDAARLALQGFEV